MALRIVKPIDVMTSYTLKMKLASSRTDKKKVVADLGEDDRFIEIARQYE